MSNVAPLATVKVPPDVERFAVKVERLRVPAETFRSSAIVRLFPAVFTPAPEIFKIL
jgi:hypothetical protein